MRPGATSTAAPTAPPRGLDQRSNRRGAQLGSQQQRLWGVSGDVCPSIAYLNCCILPATVAHFSRLVAPTCSQAVTTVHRHVRISDLVRQLVTFRWTYRFAADGQGVDVGFDAAFPRAGRSRAGPGRAWIRWWRTFALHPTAQEGSSSSWRDVRDIRDPRHPTLR